MILSLEAPAKINWFLSIKGKRDDGYHEIVSLMQCISLFDVLTFENSSKIELVSDLDLPAEENLVYRAATLLKQNTQYSSGARIELKKNIPAAAGLGGGSSDAAYTLIGLNKLWGLGLKEEELMEVGGRIGSDVPFFVGGLFSVVEGRGEIVKRMRAKSSISILLVKPDIPIAASWAYSRYAPELTKKVIDIKLFCLALENMDFASLRQMVFNDLEKGVVEKYRIVGDIKNALLEGGAEVASMSGSGSVVFGVFSSEEKARQASMRMGDHWCRTVKTLA